MRILYDAVLPQSLADEAPAAVTLDRWDGGADQPDAGLIHAAAAGEYQAVLFQDRDSLDQPDLRRIASDVGLSLVAVEAQDPIEAKVRILRNLSRLRRMLADHDCLLVLAGQVRSYHAADTPTELTGSRYRSGLPKGGHREGVDPVAEG